MNQNSLAGQTVGVQRGQHGHAGLGYAVFAPADAGDHGAAAGNVDDHALATAQRLLTDHLLRHGLGQEHVALGVDAHDPVKALFTHFQKVGAHLGRHTGVVHQGVDSSESGDRALHNFQAVVVIADIRLNIDAVNAQLFQRVQRILVLFLDAGGDHYNVITVQTQLPGNGKTNAPAGSGNDCSFFHSSRILLRYCLTVLPKGYFFGKVNPGSVQP